MVTSLCFLYRKKDIGEFSFLLAGFDASQMPPFKVGLSVRNPSILSILTSPVCRVSPGAIAHGQRPCLSTHLTCPVGDFQVSMATPVPSAVRGAYVESGGPGVLRLPTNHTESLRVRPSFWRQSLKSQGLD